MFEHANRDNPVELTLDVAIILDQKLRRAAQALFSRAGIGYRELLDRQVTLVTSAPAILAR